MQHWGDNYCSNYMLLDTAADRLQREFGRALVTARPDAEIID